MGKRMKLPDPVDLSVKIAPAIPGMEEEMVYVEDGGKRIPFYRQEIDGKTVYAEVPGRRTPDSMIIAPPVAGSEEYVTYMGNLPLYRQKKGNGPTHYSTAPEATKQVKERYAKWFQPGETKKEERGR